MTRTLVRGMPRSSASDWRVGGAGWGGAPGGGLAPLPLGDAAMGFQAGVHLVLGAEGVLDDEVGLSEAIVNVAVGVLVGLAVAEVAAFLDSGGAGLEGGFGVDAGGALFVFGLAQVGRGGG